MINSVWMTIITMTTVGYGDLFPKTLLGRVVCIMLVVWGIFVVSIMVVVLTNTFQMDQSNFMGYGRGVEGAVPHKEDRA